ncbi:hypothetical protein HMPREF1335_00115 [Enterococcus faecalis ERV62]|nr:hypothetical protein HMPREF1335_00115 [Enterococcus faecalis ERV62]
MDVPKTYPALTNHEPLNVGEHIQNDVICSLLFYQKRVIKDT